MTLRTLKLVVLLAAAVGLLVLLAVGVRDDRFLRVSTRTPPLVEEVDVGAVVSATQVNSVLKDAVYEGDDGEGNSWEVRAAEAVQQGGAEDATLTLQRVVAQWLGDEPVKVTAARGVFTQAVKKLVLDGGVVVEGMGLTMTMPEAVADVGLATLESAGGKVKIEGDMGGYDVVLTGNRFVMDERGNRLVLRGGVHGVLVE
ncbi:MAG: hypothetical protein WAZ18_05560 [Alphaproteobacteria bacterium]